MIKRICGNFPQWCAEVISSDNFVVLDTETTGLGSSDQVIEIAIINAAGSALCDGLLRPTYPIGEGAMAVHRITEEMVSKAPTFAEAWPDIERVIDGRKIIAWNAAFDARMIQQTAMAHKIILKNIDFYCAMKGYTDYCNFQKWARLTEACAALGIDFRQDHRAIGDIRATLEVIRAVAKKAEVKA
jgi:DNA polymerase III subunit epsilon